MGVPQELDGLEWKDQKMKWMIWAGYHHFRNPHIRFLLLMCTFLSSILYTTQHFVFWVSLSLCKVYLLTITDAFQTFQPSWAWRVFIGAPWKLGLTPPASVGGFGASHFQAECLILLAQRHPKDSETTRNHIYVCVQL